MNELMQELFKMLGNGDSENGGVGSLWRCAQSIYDTLRGGGAYEYANCRFWVSVEDKDEKSPKLYTFRFSAVLDNSVTVLADTYKEAREIRDNWEKILNDELANMCLNSDTKWSYDGYLNDEGESVENVAH
jgi:hypothetical protein